MYETYYEVSQEANDVYLNALYKACFEACLKQVG